ncbi:MAG: two-component sensor histidine kinase [Verrucomicrobia bacterium]|nr:two-component sensor histidine kinase [Verrucomicrobiota bacterium]MCH8528147.1 two-component sensor histidine kinase [Kiritimatiellia bacterium]
MRIIITQKIARVLFSRKSLGTSIFLYVLLPLAVLSAGIAWWALQTFERQVEAQMRRDLELVASAIERPLSHAMLREREGGIAEALRAAFDMSEVYGAYLYDADGRPISESAESPEPMDREQVTHHAAEGRSHGAFGEAGGRDVYSHFVPLTDAGGHITGLLQLTRRRSEFSRNVRALRLRGSLLFAGLFLGLSLTVLGGHHRAVGRHIQSLCDSMTHVSSGNHSHRHTPSGSREFQLLGNQFNQMLDTLENARHEIAARRESEKALEERLLHAEKLAAIGSLAAGVAHELGTPLCTIDARMQRELRRTDLSERDTTTFEAVRAETARMEHIIRQLLDFSRRNPSQFRTVNAPDLLRASLKTLAPELKASGTSVHLESEPADLYVHADPLRIEQALNNLLRNADQACPGGNIEVGFEPSETNVAIRIRDHGPGISPEHASKIFEPFFTTKAVGEGTGLGLAVVHGIATDHGGEIELRPNPAEPGCTFLLHLPKPPNTSAGAPS